jgi:hypothetical protein
MKKIIWKGKRYELIKFDRQNFAIQKTGGSKVHGYYSRLGSALTELAALLTEKEVLKRLVTIEEEVTVTFSEFVDIYADTLITTTEMLYKTIRGAAAC